MLFATQSMSARNRPEIVFGHGDTTVGTGTRSHGGQGAAQRKEEVAVLPITWIGTNCMRRGVVIRDTLFFLLRIHTFVVTLPRSERRLEHTIQRPFPFLSAGYLTTTLPTEVVACCFSCRIFCTHARR
jgi:hypothetical protein